MQNPGRLDLIEHRNNALVRTLEFQGVDLTDATFAMQVRDRKDGGQLRADLTTVTTASAEGVRLIYGGTDTVANHIAAGRIDVAPEGYAVGDALILSLVGIRINETTMEAMPFGTEIGDASILWWDIHITPSGGVKDTWLEGKFTVRGSVTE